MVIREEECRMGMEEGQIQTDYYNGQEAKQGTERQIAL